MESYLLDDSDEHFLLNDDEIRGKAQSHRGEIIWTKKADRKNNWSHSNVADIIEASGPVLSIIEDHNDNLEDSPLLINDAYRETVETNFHCHDYLNATEDVTAWKKLCTAAALCFLFMTAEILGGYLAGSLAVMTDAAHLFSDFIGFLISLLAIWIGRKSPSENMTFGYYRAEVIGALLSVLTIWLLAAIFSTLAINRLYNNDYHIDANTMIIVSSLGLVVNILMGIVLHGVCHTHSHALSNENHSANNINVRAAAIHILGDFVQSIGVLLAALIIKFNPGAQIADPICTLIFSLIVICTTIKVGRDSIWYLLEGSPISSWKMKLELKKLSAIKHIHNLHIWSLAPGRNVVTVHLAVDQYCDRDLLLKKVSSIIQSQINIVSCTVQIESYSFDSINSCQHCQIPQC